MTFRHDPLGPRPGHEVGIEPTSQTPAWVDEAITVIRSSLRIAAAADAAGVAGMRRDFAAWLAVDVTGELLDDVVLAVYEALANAAEHAYADTADRAGAVHLAAHRTYEAARITVTDSGRWRPRRTEPFRNRGLGFVHTLISQVHIASGAAGTTVHLHTRLPPPH